MASPASGRPDWGTPETNTMPHRAASTQRSFLGRQFFMEEKGEASVTNTGAM